MFLTHASGVWVVLKAADYGKKRKKAPKDPGPRHPVQNKRPGPRPSRSPKGHVFKTEKDVHGELRFFVLEAAVLQKGARSVDVGSKRRREGSRYNARYRSQAAGLTFLNGIDSISNGEDWIVREEVTPGRREPPHPGPPFLVGAGGAVD